MEDVLLPTIEGVLPAKFVGLVPIVLPGTALAPGLGPFMTSPLFLKDIFARILGRGMYRDCSSSSERFQVKLKLIASSQELLKNYVIYVKTFKQRQRLD